MPNKVVATGQAMIRASRRPTGIGRSHGRFRNGELSDVEDGDGDRRYPEGSGGPGHREDRGRREDSTGEPLGRRAQGRRGQDPGPPSALGLWIAEISQSTARAKEPPIGLANLLNGVIGNLRDVEAGNGDDRQIAGAQAEAPVHVLQRRTGRQRQVTQQRQTHAQPVPGDVGVHEGTSPSLDRRHRTCPVAEPGDLEPGHEAVGPEGTSVADPPTEAQPHIGPKLEGRRLVKDTHARVSIDARSNAARESSGGRESASYTTTNASLAATSPSNVTAQYSAA